MATALSLLNLYPVLFGETSDFFKMTIGRQIMKNEGLRTPSIVIGNDIGMECATAC